MKNIIAIGLLFFSLIASAQKDNAKSDTVTITTSAVCGMCVETIQKGYAFEKGVNSSSVDLENGTVTVVYNSKKTDEETVRTALTNMGYTADGNDPDMKAYDNLHFCCKAGYDKINH